MTGRVVLEGGQSSQSQSTIMGPARLQSMSVEQLVLELIVPEKREKALLLLSIKRDALPNLGPILWHSFGTIAVLLQEIMSIYPMLSPPTLTSSDSWRVCKALALLQCVASHQETRAHFWNAGIPLYLYPFLNTPSKTAPFENLRLTSLGVIGVLFTVNDTGFIDFLLSTEIVPLCLQTMEFGSELSKTIGTFIIHKIMLHDVGLEYICATAERFFAVGDTLENMLKRLIDTPCVKLLKQIIRCYLRLIDNVRAFETLKNHLPALLKDGTFNECLREEVSTQRLLTQLLIDVGGDGPRFRLCYEGIISWESFWAPFP